MKTKVSKWEKISTETVFEKYGRKIEKVIYKMPGGNEEVFYLKKEGPGCGVLALTEDNKVILIKQYRPGPDEILYDLPGGYVDGDENPETAMKRELLEETGYEGDLKYAGYTFADSYSNMKYFCYVATGCRKVAEQNLEPNEHLELEFVSMSKFREILKNGLTADTHIAYLGLDYLGLLSTRLD